MSHDKWRDIFQCQISDNCQDGLFVNRICHGPWNAFFMLRVANYGMNFVEQVIRLGSTWTAGRPGVHSCLTPHSISVFVVFFVFFKKLLRPMVKKADKVWLHFHDLPGGHRRCLHCAWKPLPLAGRAREHIASHSQAAANLQGLLDRRLGVGLHVDQSVKLSQPSPSSVPGHPSTTTTR